MRCLWIFAAFAVVGLSPTQTHAQDDEAQRRATARELFRQGVEHVDGERWAEAAEAFGRAYGLYPRGAIALNWGLALIHQEELVAASEAFQRVVHHDDSSSTQREQALAQLEQIEPRLGHLTIRAVTDGEAVAMEAGLGLRLDGTPVLPELVGVDVPVDPGSHELVAMRGDVTGPTSTVDVAEGATVEVVVEMPPAPQVATPAVAASLAIHGDDQRLSAPEVAEAGEVTDEAWFWVLVGGGAAVVIAAVATAIGVAVSSSAGPVCDEDTVNWGCETL